MKVWVVGVGDVEGSGNSGLYKTKKSAVKAILGQRDLLIADWKRMLEYNNKKHGGLFNEMYEGMIKNLSSDDYESWDNYPHDCPFMYEMEVEE